MMMKLEKLSTKDWMSSRLCLKNVQSRPKSKQRVIVVCSKCNVENSRVFSEIVRSVNIQSKFVNCYHCRKCYVNLQEYKKLASDNSKAVLDKIIVGASERSKKLWEDPDYRARCESNSKKLSESDEFSKKVSKSLKIKFTTDHAYVARINASRFNKPAQFLAKCSDIHDCFYDYSKTVYKGTNTLFDIICPHHGVFTQFPSNHIKGHGCPQCAIDRSRLNSDDYFSICAKVHQNKYDYSESNYDGSLTYLMYRCPKHGVIQQLAQNHLKGAGCRFCAASASSSAGEREIVEFIKSLSFNIVRNDRSVLDGQEIDIFLPEIGFGIEYHGIYWHSYNTIETFRSKRRHFRKLNDALNKGILLVQIYENEWLEKKNIVKSMIKAKLGQSDRLYARSCDVVKISDKEAEVFFNTNHLNGHRKSNLCVGLKYDDEIFAAISLHTSNRNELMRFCNKLGYTVIGGLSRLIKNSGCNQVFTYADRRYSPMPVGYLSSGFKCIGLTQPGYNYCRGLKLYSRQSFQKHKLKHKLKIFDSSLTEAENMFQNGYRRLWDAGHYKLLWRNNENGYRAI